MLNNQTTCGDRNNDEIKDILDIFNFVEFFEQNKRTRRFKYKNKRLDWEEHLKMLRHTCQFDTTYRCKESTFKILVDILWNDIVVNFTRSFASTEGNTPIYPELIVAAGLQYLIGV